MAFGHTVAGATVGTMALQRIYAFGPHGSLREVEPEGYNRIYNPKQDNWTFGANMPDPGRINFGVAVLNDAIYVIGGAVYDNYVVGTLSPSAVNEQYMPLGYGSPDPSIIPKITVQSPVAQTYNETAVVLAFTVDKHINWTGYSLDGKDNVTSTGNITLSGLSSGLHNITVYAGDSFGNVGASQTISFTVNPEPLDAIHIVTLAIGVVVAVVAVVCIIYLYRKRSPARKV